ncbi:uncharacterized protein LOC115632418 [Scaptodrosophila lebanonensis]|uniref:Uncharacterized protein LOC115632418 n=1 Tax=Drosophila lebanonensis TaxID=7225 RepID=A0A6J2UE66_DROLE|nr:uncharacterized protein LOC115632418 [Scaptodrosophila lebanonensis]
MAQVVELQLDMEKAVESVTIDEKNSVPERAPTAVDKHDTNADADAKIASAANDESTVKLDKLDELSSLEQEIAKMHNISIESSVAEQSEEGLQECGKSVPVRSSSGAENGGSGTDTKTANNEPAATRTVPTESGNGLQHVQGEGAASALEEVDLIALLKGTDTGHDQEEKKLELALAELDNVGVTIEGEGQYEIMEIDDGDNSLEAQAPHVDATKKTTSSPIMHSNKPQNKPKLSPEQARAVALEQMADLKSQAQARRKESNVTAKPQDIISTLNDDWSEYDSGGNDAIVSNASLLQATKKLQVKMMKPSRDISHLDDKPIINSVLVVKAMPPFPKPTKLIEKEGGANTESSSTENIGFKRQRVIKRKIIWDPDVPETQRSYSQYASPKTVSTPPPVTTTSAIKPSNISSPTLLTQVAKKEGMAKKARATTPKARQRPESALKDPIKLPVKRASTPSRAPTAKVEVTSPSKRRSQTPVSTLPNGAGAIKKKKISELDRLMGDEGAVVMIQAVEQEKRELSGGDNNNTNNKVMRKRAMTIVGRPTRVGDSTTVSPKKEETTNNASAAKPTKSAKSATSDVDAVFAKTSTVTGKTKSRASDSWDYVYKQRASEESMIMRRRSNSSYSSNASVTRVSLDAKPNAILSDDEPSFKFLKPETKSSQRSGDASAGHTLANDLKRDSQPQKERKSPNSANTNKSQIVTLHKLDKVAQLVINTARAKSAHTYNIQLLHKLTDMLNKVAKSNEYNTVLLCTQDQQFCQGIDCHELIAPAVEKRKNNASQLASALKTYLKTLATFPKPLIAGIAGNIKNLGVMQLPLLDYVVAAENCYFDTSYAKLGHLPEGYSLWNNHPKVSNSVHTRLFLLGERLHTSDLETPNGLINCVSPACSVNDEALNLAKRISTTTAENYRLLKRSQHATTRNLDALSHLDEEFQVITEQWVTSNCQANLKRYLSDTNV